MRIMAIGASVLAGVAALALPSGARADTRVGIGVFIGHDDHRRGRYDTFGIGYDRGLEDGYRSGRGDGRRGDYDFWRDRRYRNGDAGYRRDYGSRHEYVAGYRRGYREGYNRAYSVARHRYPGRDGWGYDSHDRWDGDRGWDRRGR